MSNAAIAAAPDGGIMKSTTTLKQGSTRTELKQYTQDTPVQTLTNRSHYVEQLAFSKG